MTVVKMTANVQCTYVNVLYIHTVQQNVFFFSYDLTIANILQLYTKLQMVQM